MKDIRGIKWNIIEQEKDIVVIAKIPNKKFREFKFWRIKENEIEKR